MQLRKLLLLIVFIAMNNLFAQDNTSVFKDEDWDLSGAKKVEHLGRESIMGYALMKNANFENGIIEVDIATTGERSYPGIMFRMQDLKTYERFYIRPHRGHLYPDALQYVGCNNGVDSWQLYNGPGATALIDIPSGKWNHVKIVVAGSQAKVFWNESSEPVLEVDYLEHGLSRGTIALNGPMDGSAYFSNFKFSSDNTIQFEKPDEPKKVIGALKDWKISQPFAVGTVDFEKYPENQNLDPLQWKDAAADETGRVDVSKFYPRKNMLGDCIFAKTILNAETAKRVELGFGYSDFITIFLNGEPVYSGNSAYQSRDRSFLGILGYFDNIFLPLKKGENELLIILGESSGGWAFQFRDNDAVYIEKGITELWTSENIVQIPESIVYDQKRNVCYVSSYFYEGRECLAKIDMNGKVLQREWITGLARPTGVTIFNDRLYCVDRRFLYEIDIENDSVKNKIPIPDAKFPNDVTVDDNGVVYISDSNADAVYMYKDGKFETLIQGDVIDNANGILYDKGKLLVGAGGTGWVKKIDPATKLVEPFCYLGRGKIIDGIKADGQLNYLVSDNAGILYRITADGKKSEILNTTTSGQNLADFDYIPSEKIIVIPGWLSNKITAYKFN